MQSQILWLQEELQKLRKIKHEKDKELVRLKHLNELDEQLDIQVNSKLIESCMIKTWKAALSFQYIPCNMGTGVYDYQLEFLFVLNRGNV